MSQDSRKYGLGGSHKTEIGDEPEVGDEKPEVGDENEDGDDLHSKDKYPYSLDLIEERIDAYLEGWMESEEAAVFERDLLNPKVGEAFGKELMLRDLLATTPETEPPSSMVERIETALQVSSLHADFMIEASNSRKPSPGKTEKKVGRDKAERSGWLKNAFSGLKWSVRGPSFALQSTSGRTGLTSGSVGGLTTMAAGSRGAASGLSGLRYALGSPTEQKVRSTKSRAQRSQQKERRNGINNRAQSRQGRVSNWIMGKLKASKSKSGNKQETRKSNTWKAKAGKTLWRKAMGSLHRQ